METIESISFEVENDLEKPNSYLKTTEVKPILEDLFKTRKYMTNEQGKQIPLKCNEPLEVFHYTLDTDETQFFNYDKKSLIQGLIEAYKNHFPIVVSPDWIWLLIMQGYTRFMEKYSEKVRDKVVNFSDKKDLKVLRILENGITPRNCPKEIWDGIMKEYTEKIGTHIGKEFKDVLECNFSTTTPAVKVTSQVTIMSAMKDYFAYKALFAGCGISKIILEGKIEDWVEIRKKLDFLNTKGLEWWVKYLNPIIDRIIFTKKYISYHKKPNQSIINFWKYMIRIKGKGEMYDPHIINGWIVAFIPDLREENPKLYERLNEYNIPDEIISCPMDLTWLPLTNDTKTEYKISLASGFYGMVQDKTTFAVKPVIGYSVVVEEEKTSKVSKDEINKLIKDYSS